MLDFFPIYKREVKLYFQSASTYVILALFFLIIGLIYHQLMLFFSQVSLQSMTGGYLGQQSQAPNVTESIIRQIFNLMVSLVMFTVPILSMRLLAEEKNKGTFELLVSCPIGDWSILLGKYFALVTIGLVIAAISGVYPFLAWWAGRANGSSPEWPVVASCAIGLVMIFAAYAAFGIMASAFTDNQMTAAIITLIGLILWQIVGSFDVGNLPFVRQIVTELSAYEHSTNFINGVLTLKDFAYYVLASFVFLFVASKALDARRWRI
jgi:ABC-2 type transport system permease protein